jgi:hypothetical protein
MPHPSSIVQLGNAREPIQKRYSCPFKTQNDPPMRVDPQNLLWRRILRPLQQRKNSAMCGCPNPNQPIASPHELQSENKGCRLPENKGCQHEIAHLSIIQQCMLRIASYRPPTALVHQLQNQHHHQDMRTYLSMMGPTGLSLGARKMNPDYMSTSSPTVGPSCTVQHLASPYAQIHSPTNLPDGSPEPESGRNRYQL